MRIHDTSAAFVLQPFLVPLAYHGIKGIDICPLGRSEPIVHVRSVGIPIGHRRTCLKGIDVPQHEVSDVLDLLLAQITPEKWARLNMSLRPVAIGQSQIKIL